MDITQQELNTMKAKQLRKIVREAIDEVLAESTIDISGNPNTLTPQQQQSLIQQARTKTKNPRLGTVDEPVEFVEEAEIEEMARIAKGFRLADPNFDASQYANKRISGTSMEDIINFFRENPGAEKSQLQSQFGFVRPQIANAVVNGLLDVGVLVKLGAGGEIEATPEPGEEAPVKATEPEDLFMGSAMDPLAMYFDNTPNADGEEDFNAEEEPTAGDIEGQPIATSDMSDEDYEAFMKYTDLKGQLDATKSNIIKMKRSKGGTAGDIKDKPSSDLERLRALKKSLEDRVNALVASSDYLKKRTGQEAAPEVTGAEEDETVTEGLDEYIIRKMQYYAGIRK